MTKNFLYLSILVALITSLKSFDFFTSTVVAPTIEEMKLMLQTANTETKFALGLKLRLSEADISDIERLPGINLKIASEIMETRNAIIAKAKILQPDKRYKIFETIKGIGEIKAKQLALYLDVSG